jgi:hypothetical protein
MKKGGGMKNDLIAEVPGLYRIIALKPFRRTEGVTFDLLPMDFLPVISGIDRVLHRHGAISPGAIAGVERPWYMHPQQEDNLLVLQGRRTVDIYTREHGRVETFVVEPERVSHNGRTVCDFPAMLVWPRRVFHRIASGSDGSISLNFAARDRDCDMKTNFNIFDLDTETGAHTIVREGHLDQS